MSTDPAAAQFPPYKLARVAALIPYARNARLHSDAQVAQIAASIREFGFTNPVLVDAGRGVIAGHGRLLAARKLGMREVPTLELSHLTAPSAVPTCWSTTAWRSPPAGIRTCSGSSWASCRPRASTSP